MVEAECEAWARRRRLESLVSRVMLLGWRCNWGGGRQDKIREAGQARQLERLYWWH